MEAILERTMFELLGLRSFFFFQAEDGIRYLTVTGVQTCALPISDSPASRPPRRRAPAARAFYGTVLPGKHQTTPAIYPRGAEAADGLRLARQREEIGRASCRERV